MTNIDSERLNRAESYGKIREWAERLKKFEGVPDMYRDIPSYPQVLTDEYKALDTPRASDAARAVFLDKHLDYLDSVRRQVQLKDPGYLKLQQLIAENSESYPGGQFAVGIDPYKEMRTFADRIKGTANPFFEGLTSPAHELYGHYRPALLGIQPSIDPVTVPGLPGVYKPSIISPTNESLAHFMNDAIVRNLGATTETIKSDPELLTFRHGLKYEHFPHFSTRGPGRDQTGLRDVGQIDDIRSAISDLTQQPLDKSPYTPYQAGRQVLRQLRDAAPGQEPRRLQDIVDALRKSNYLSQSAFTNPENIPEAFREVITSNLVSKYVDPSLNNFVQGLRISTPGFGRYTDSPSAVARGLSSVDEASSVASARLADLVALDPSKNYSELGMMIFGKDPVTSAAKGFMEGVRRNPAGAAGGAAMTLLNDKVAEALAKDDYGTAATEAAKDVALGAAAETGLKQVVAPLAQRVAPAAAARVAPYVAGAARVGIPAAIGTGLFMQGRTGSALDTLINKAATVAPGLKANPKTDIARRAGSAISNQARYVLNSILQNKVPYLKGKLF